MGAYAEQTTIARPVIKTGIGIHTGQECAVSLLPAEPDAGVAFVTGSGEAIPATADHVVDAQRGTTLGAGTARIGGVEHLMAALYGMAVDNVTLEVTGPEIPACDGSAAEWVEALAQAGVRPLGARRRVWRLKREVWAAEGTSWAMAGPGAPGLTLAVGVEFEGTAAGRQALWLRLSLRRFVRELAPARTFAMADELEALNAAGLGRGGSRDNAFAVGREGYSGPLRFSDEVVRHKALDLVGDLALSGCHFSGLVVAIRPSHRTNVELARALREELVRSGLREAARRC